MVQWLRLRTSNAGHMGSISSQGTKIPHALLPKKKKKVHCWRCYKRTILNLEDVQVFGREAEMLKDRGARILTYPGDSKNTVSR